MDNDETLIEFVQILGRIKFLLGDAANSDDEELDLSREIERLRRSGNDKDADELSELIRRADELKARHQAES